MSKHTPGPWKPIPFGSMEECDIVGPSHDPVEEVFQYIATVYGGLGGEDETTSRANGRLISAAPDLLAACKLVLAEGFSESDKATWAHDLVAKLNAAIAKAEGS